MSLFLIREFWILFLNFSSQNKWHTEERKCIALISTRKKKERKKKTRSHGQPKQKPYKLTGSKAALLRHNHYLR